MVQVVPIDAATFRRKLLESDRGGPHNADDIRWHGPGRSNQPGRKDLCEEEGTDAVHARASLCRTLS